MTAAARLRSQSTKDASEGEGACLAEFKGRSHLPLRGKLGWMTPRIWCENDTGYERGFRASRSQAGAPFFCPDNLVFAQPPWLPHGNFRVPAGRLAITLN